LSSDHDFFQDIALSHDYYDDDDDPTPAYGDRYVLVFLLSKRLSNISTCTIEMNF